MSGGRRRDELAVNRVQPGDGAVLPDGAGVVRHLLQERRVVEARRVVLRRHDEARSRGGWRQVPSRARSPHRAIAWRVPVEGGILQSGVMSTAGGFVFYGDSNGEFVAVDAKTGKNCGASRPVRSGRPVR